jgi:glycosyltransferase involved in cell wall biosynthesis
VRVLLADLETAWRGGQNQLFLLLKGLREHGHDAELVAAHSSALAERAATLGAKVHSVSREFFRLPAAIKIRALLRSGSFDIAHANEAHAVTAVWLALAKKDGPTYPFVISRRVGYPIGKSSLAKRRYQRSTKIVANSKWVAEQAVNSGAPREKISVVYEGVEIPRPFTPEERQQARSRWGVSPPTPLLGCVGVLLPDKGQEWLIRALVELRRKFADVKLLLAGDGPCRSKLESLAHELGLENEVIFAGFVKDVESAYAAIDVFLLPSFFEALNNSLLAAMAYEIPSIAFNRGALGEIIEDGRNGLLVSAPDEISAAASKFLGNAEFARNLGHAGRVRVEQHFSAEKMVRGMIQVYQECLPGNPT